MIDRRNMSAGLLASMAALLAGSKGSFAADGEGGFNPFEQTYGGGESHFRSNVRTTPATLDELMQPGPLREMTLGRAEAKVKVIEYFSLTCPVCRAFHANHWDRFIRTYVDSGKAFYIAREFPIGRSSGNASIALRCNEGNYFATLNQLLAQQRRWVSQDVRLDAIHAVAAPMGLKRQAFDQCLANKDLIRGIDAIKQRGRALGVIGTPTFFVNDRQLRGSVTLADLAAAIDPLLG